jgi:hypothetical protein
MNFINKLFGIFQKSGNKNDKEYSELDNIGTRINSAESNEGLKAVYVTKRITSYGSVYYSFDSKDKAISAMLEIPCIKMASDSKDIISLQMIEFGVYMDHNSNNRWVAFLQGQSLSVSTYNDAVKSFIKHNGQKIFVKKPEDVKPKQTSVANKSNADGKAGVKFIHYTYPVVMGVTNTKEIYEAPNKSVAIEFLKSKNISKQFYYIEIQTPDGWVGKDIMGVYEF